MTQETGKNENEDIKSLRPFVLSENEVCTHSDYSVGASQD